MRKTPLSQLLTVASLLVTPFLAPAAHAAEPERETITPAFAFPLANAAGKTMTAVTVTYAPGAKTPSHRHGKAFVVGYVLEGAIRSKVAGGEERVYRAGESWSELPGAHHLMSENASTTAPAKLLAIFVADKNEKNLVAIDGDKAAK